MDSVELMDLYNWSTGAIMLYTHHVGHTPVHVLPVLYIVALIISKRAGVSTDQLFSQAEWPLRLQC